MKPKYKIGDNVFYTSKGRQSFGIVKKITIQIEETASMMTYEVNEDMIEETDIMGRAVIQKPRVRPSRSKKALGAARTTMNGTSTTQATA